MVPKFVATLGLVIVISVTTMAASVAAGQPRAPAIPSMGGVAVLKTDVACGAFGCRATWRPWDSWDWWGWPPPADYVYPPACPYGYRYRCRPSPYGGGLCACWPW